MKTTVVNISRVIGHKEKLAKPYNNLHTRGCSRDEKLNEVLDLGPVGGMYKM